MTDRRSGYKAFLLRLWRADNGGQPVWRLMLQEAGTQQQHFFSGTDALQTFLADLMTEQDGAEGRSGPTDSGSRLPEALAREDDL